jgi:hypothetical protein
MFEMLMTENFGYVMFCGLSSLYIAAHALMAFGRYILS